MELAQRTEELRWAADLLHTACRDSGLLLGDALKQDERLARIPDLSTALYKLSNVLAYTRKVSYDAGRTSIRRAIAGACRSGAPQPFAMARLASAAVAIVDSYGAVAGAHMRIAGPGSTVLDCTIILRARNFFRRGTLQRKPGGRKGP